MGPSCSRCLKRGVRTTACPPGERSGSGSRSPPLPEDVGRRQPCGSPGPPVCLFSFDLKVWPQTREFEVLLF